MVSILSTPTSTKKLQRKSFWTPNYHTWCAILVNNFVADCENAKDNMGVEIEKTNLILQRTNYAY